MRNYLLLLGIMLFAISCGTQDEESNLDNAPSGHYLRIGNQDTFLKIRNEQSSGLKLASEKCTLYAGTYIPIQAAATTASGNHYLVNTRTIIPGCGFSKGYVYAPHMAEVSSGSSGGSSNGMYFPITTRPEANYKVGVPSFGWGRDGGSRLHAGSDLYTRAGRTVRAISDGVVRDRYYFYRGTWALVVEHTLPDGSRRVVRYGEIAPGSGLPVGTRVKSGQKVGAIGVLTGIPQPMLHFEYYQGNRQGPLTVRSSRPFQRRGDLLNPETLLDRLQKTL
ncbi:MAG: M23 family metallopeptidase [Pseudobacteriovorax sp.]|nr:M23 family metallopeptidase [Pseudobacteriovorax sp.]